MCHAQMKNSKRDWLTSQSDFGKLPTRQLVQRLRQLLRQQGAPWLHPNHKRNRHQPDQQPKRLKRVDSEARKRDTREKIELGGLVVKAGLRGAERAMILGLLLEGATLAPDSERYRALLLAGRAEFAAERHP